jgi:hypothetical protein
MSDDSRARLVEQPCDITLPGPFLSISGGSRQGLWLDNLHLNLAQRPQAPAGGPAKETQAILQVDKRSLWVTNLAIKGNNGRLQALSLNNSWLLLAGALCMVQYLAKLQEPPK